MARSEYAERIKLMDAATQRPDFTRDAIAAFHAAHGYALPSKPRYTQACNHCGICCALALCPIGEKAYPGQSAPCPALVVLEGQAKCGIVMMEEHAGFEPIVRKVLGIGCGCSMEDDDTTEEQAAAFDARSRAMVFGHNDLDQRTGRADDR